jgi:hypothetical protein
VRNWSREQDLHLRPPGYEPGELLLLHPASRLRGDGEIARSRCWRKADGSNATPCGAHPLSKRVAGHSGGAFHFFSMDVPARLERATSAFGRRRSCPTELRDVASSSPSPRPYGERAGVRGSHTFNLGASFCPSP